jgi:transcriptional regulator with XRE-family HTH domain
MEQLARLRELKGFSQRALAKESGVSPATIYELENGRRRPNPSTLRKLASALHVEVADLLGADYPKAPRRSSLEPSLFNGLEDERLASPDTITISTQDLYAMFRRVYNQEREPYAAIEELSPAQQANRDAVRGEARPKGTAPGSPREWLRAKDVLLLSLTEEELADHFAALDSDESVKFADRINNEWQAVEMARDLAEDPNAPLVHDAYVHATSRYFQARTLAPISTSYDPDNPEKPEQVMLRLEKPETPARSRREGMDDVG